MPPKIPKRRLGSRETIESAGQFAVECLLGNVATRIEWVESVGKTIIERSEAGYLIRDPMP
jgi:hypothetical protein